MGFGILSDELRLYPTEIEREVSPSDTEKIRPKLNPSMEEDLIWQEWRVNFDTILVDGVAMSDLPGQDGWSASAFCASWQIVDWMHYGGNAVDLVVFLVGAEMGKVFGVEVPVHGEMFLFLWIVLIEFGILQFYRSWRGDQGVNCKIERDILS